jgi:thiosulfate dehydrogenase [quinone] large subunit
MEKLEYFGATLRIALGWLFFWAFLDKLFGLGIATAHDKSWLLGNSPTTGFLSHAGGWFAGTFKALAGSSIVDWLFMLGLLFIGLSLLSGIGLKIATWSGAILALLMWLAEFPPANNPIFDEHIIYIIGFFGIYVLEPRAWSLHGWWKDTSLVQKYPWLE